MSTSRENSAQLQCHPDTPSTVVENITANIRWDEGRNLTIKYSLTGAVERLRIPEDQSAIRADELWQHTCFELFIGAQNDAEYYEFNFSPSGEWAAYEFRNYRDGGPIHVDGLDPKIAVQRSAEALELSAKVRLNRLPGIQPDVYLCIGLSAVIESARRIALLLGAQAILRESLIFIIPTISLCRSSLRWSMAPLSIILPSHEVRHRSPHRR